MSTGTGNSYKVLFTVRRQYFDAISDGSKLFELRRATKRWRTISRKVTACLESGGQVEAVFLCGRKVLRKQVWYTWVARTARMVLGREISEQGKKDIGTSYVAVFFLREPV